MSLPARTFARPGVAYRLGRALYLSLTDESNATPLALTRGPSFVMPASSAFVCLGDAPEPRASELVAAVDAFYDSFTIASSGEDDPGVVFAGYGEPLMRLQTLCDTIANVRERRHGAKLRVSTNGLFDASAARALRDAGAESITVNLASADPEQYARLMKPKYGRTHADACAFVEAAAANGLQVECTAVKAPGVDVRAVERLALALGAVEFREREYFP